MDYAVNRLGATASTDRLMRENFERGLHEGEEYQYWQKVSALKELLDLLSIRSAVEGFIGGMPIPIGSFEQHTAHTVGI